jgi:hypothetical protein
MDINRIERREGVQEKKHVDSFKVLSGCKTAACFRNDV